MTTIERINRPVLNKKPRLSVVLLIHWQVTHRCPPNQSTLNILLQIVPDNLDRLGLPSEVHYFMLGLNLKHSFFRKQNSLFLISHRYDVIETFGDDRLFLEDKSLAVVQNNPLISD